MSQAPPQFMPAPAQSMQPDLNLKQYWEILWRRKWLFIQVFLVVMGVGVWMALQGQPLYQTQAKLLVNTPAFSLNVYEAGNPISPILAMNQADSLETQLEEMRGSKFQAAVYKATAEEMEARQIPRKPNENGASLSVEPAEGTSIVNLVAKGGNPEEIAILANKAVEYHLRRAHDKDLEGIRKAIKYAEDRRAGAQAELTKIQNQLVSSAQANPAITSDSGRDTALAELTTQRGRLEGARQNLALARSALADLEARLKRARVQIEQKSFHDNPQYPLLQAKLAELNLQRELELNSYKPEHPRVKLIDANIDSVKKLLAGQQPELEETKKVPNPERPQIEAQILTQRELVSKYSAEVKDAQARIQTLDPLLHISPIAQYTRENLKVLRDTRQNEVNQYDQILRDLQMRWRAQPVTTRAIEMATAPDPEHPIAPDRKRSIIVSFVIALGLAMALTILQEFLDDRINTPSDLDRVTTLPTLAHVPMLQREQPRLVSDLPANSQVGEAFRALRSSIGFAAIDAPIRRILVTSPSKGEGKSVTSANIASAMALDGKRVILVDADLRKPSVHALFGLPNSPGLSEVLAGIANLEDVIRDTNVENLRVVCAGPVPPNPAELVGSRTCESVIEQLEDDADVVIFDSPPCVPVSDPLILASRMDGVILVVHVGQTRKGAVRQAEQLLTRARARMLGLVFNRVQFKKGQYYYYYGYSYGYGYGYGGYGEGSDRAARRRSPVESPVAEDDRPLNGGGYDSAGPDDDLYPSDNGGGRGYTVEYEDAAPSGMRDFGDEPRGGSRTMRQIERHGSGRSSRRGRDRDLDL